MSKCGNNSCQWHKFCQVDKNTSKCVHWIEPKLVKMKNIKVMEDDYDRVVKILKKNNIEFQ